MYQERWSSFGRLTHTAQLILTCLEERPMGGGELLSSLSEVHHTWLEPGTLWAALRRLEQKGWISLLETDSPAVHAPRYCVKDTGLKALYQEQISSVEQGDRIGTGGHVSRGIFQVCMMIALKWILRLYPRGWRERYEAEMIDLLATHDITLLTLLDLLFNVIDARLDPFYRRPSRPLPIHLLKQWRIAIIASFCAVPLSTFFYVFFIDERGDSAWIYLRDHPIMAFLHNFSEIVALAIFIFLVCACLLLAYKDVRRENARPNLFPMMGLSTLVILLSYATLALPFTSLLLDVGLSGIVMFILAVLISIPLVKQGIQRRNKQKFGVLHLLPLMGACVLSVAFFLGTLFQPDQAGGIPSPMSLLAMMLLLASMLFTLITLVVAIVRIKLDNDKHLLSPLLLVGALTTGAMMLNHVTRIVQQAVTSFIWPGGNWSSELIIGLLMTMLPTLIAFLFLLRSLRLMRKKEPPTGVSSEPLIMPYQQQAH